MGIEPLNGVAWLFLLSQEFPTFRNYWQMTSLATTGDCPPLHVALEIDPTRWTYIWHTGPWENTGIGCATIQIHLNSVSSAWNLSWPQLFTPIEWLLWISLKILLEGTLQIHLPHQVGLLRSRHSRESENDKNGLHVTVSVVDRKGFNLTAFCDWQMTKSFHYLAKVFCSGFCI